jgi:hypothetical protein
MQLHDMPAAKMSDRTPKNIRYPRCRSISLLLRPINRSIGCKRQRNRSVILHCLPIQNPECDMLM